MVVASRSDDVDEETRNCVVLTPQRRLEENTAVIAAAHENVARLTAELQALQHQSDKGMQRRPCASHQKGQADVRVQRGT